MKETPLTFTPEKGAEIVETLRSGAFLETAAAAAGISKVTLYSWLRRGRRGETPELADWSVEVRKVMAASEVSDIMLIKAAADAGVWQAAAWRLERKYPQKYGKRGDEAMIEEKVERKLRKLLADAKKVPGQRLRAVG